MKRCNNCFEIIEDSYAFCPNCGYKEGNPPKDAYFLYPGVVLQGRYIIGEAIGFGGFGITYKAFDSVLGSVIAIKEFYPSGIDTFLPIGYNSRQTDIQPLDYLAQEHAALGKWIKEASIWIAEQF